LEISTQVQIIPQWWEIQIIYRIIMHKTIYKFQCKLQLKQREESPRTQWKATELFKKQWADNKLINSVLVILPRITPITKATNQEMDQTDQLQQWTVFIAQVDLSAALLDQVPEPEQTAKSPTPDQSSPWSSVHASQTFKTNKTPGETWSELTEEGSNQFLWAQITQPIVECAVNFMLSR
jgi:hypothetical protein